MMRGRPRTKGTMPTRMELVAGVTCLWGLGVLTKEQIGARFGVSISTVYRILRGTK